MTKTVSKPCEFCGTEMTGSPLKRYCSENCRKPVIPKSEGIYCPIGGINQCAICADIGDHVHSKKMTQGDQYCQGKRHGVLLCSFQCEEEWGRRHAFRKGENIKMVGGNFWSDMLDRKKPDRREYGHGPDGPDKPNIYHADRTAKRRQECLEQIIWWVNHYLEDITLSLGEFKALRRAIATELNNGTVDHEVRKKQREELEAAKKRCGEVA